MAQNFMDKRYSPEDALKTLEFLQSAVDRRNSSFDRFVVYVVLNERRNVYRNRMAIQLCIGLCHDFIGARSVCACRSGDESL